MTCSQADKWILTNAEAVKKLKMLVFRKVNKKEPEGRMVKAHSDVRSYGLIRYKKRAL
jgi:hypothetical protein